MDVSDKLLWSNLDPVYLLSVLQTDFLDFDELWVNNMSNRELLDAVNTVKRYSPIVEDISMDDVELCTAVESIEKE